METNNSTTLISHSFDCGKRKKTRSIFKGNYAELRNANIVYRGWFLFCLVLKSGKTQYMNSDAEVVSHR